MALTETMRYFNFYKILERMERGKTNWNQSSRLGRVKGRWRLLKEAGPRSTKKAKIRCEKAKRQNGTLEILLERASIELMKSDNTEDDRADEINLR
jgi:hypothetical protein